MISEKRLKSDKLGGSNTLIAMDADLARRSGLIAVRSPRGKQMARCSPSTIIAVSDLILLNRLHLKMLSGHARD